MTTDPALIQVLEASLEELIVMRSRTDLRPEIGYYRDCLILFHKGDHQALQAALADPRVGDPVRLAVELRLALLNQSLTLEKVREAERRIPGSNAWEAELTMLIASCYAALERPEEAKNWFELATSRLSELGAKEKALRAELNSIVAIGHIHPNSRLIAEYYYLYKKAKASKNRMVTATSLLNLSKEYQKLGALRHALRFCRRSLSASRDHFGAEIYSFALAHRAHLLLELGRPLEAAEDIELLRTSKLAPVQAAVAVLRKLYPKAFELEPIPEVSPEIEKASLPGWRERLALASEKMKQLSPREETLIGFISEAPRKKFEICDFLFGSDLHPFLAENRLKNILWRIRKKFPGMVVFENDHYFLAVVEAPRPRSTSKVS